MSRIFATRISPTLAGLVEELATPAHHGQVVEAWLFNDVQSRRAAEKELAKHGIDARFHSAYKPLLHFFLEDLDLSGSDVTDIRVLYPHPDHAADNRFLLETYPLAALVGQATIAFAANDTIDCTYEVTLRTGSGDETRLRVFAPNKVHQDIINETHLSPTGWIRVEDVDGNRVRDERIETDYEILFSQTMKAIAEHDWGDKEPYFDELNINVEFPGMDQPIAHDHEVISLHEALHEDLYLSLLEYFQVKSGRPLGDRGLQPGQIVPEIRRCGLAVSVMVETRPLSITEILGPDQELVTARAPITSAQITKELDKIDGKLFTASSRSGRTLSARYCAGSDAPIMISGGQHANETTGVVGALRAARTLAKREGAHFTISPLENPDGYALHQRLIVDNPYHMHHAARYTALGDDLEFRYGTDQYEKEIRVKAQGLSKARLHINLHGYPSHEWTRPLSGYVPRGFNRWTLPKGMFLIIRHHDDWTDRAEAFVDRVTQKLTETPGLLAFNNAQIELYRNHASETGFRIINGFPCLISCDNRQEIPLTLITEYPDETIYGDHFIAGHSVQMATVMAAYEAYQDLSH
jgi:hypothetical protein